jgi:hypothetical protein
MKRMTRYCRTICSDCSVVIVTQKNDNVERRRVAEIFARQYGMDYKPEDINCDCCISDTSHIFSYCNVCETKKCGREKQVKNCAYCPEHQCEKLFELFSEHSKAKETLEEIRRELSII